MRHIVFPIILMIVILLFCLFSAVFVSNSVDQTSQYLSDAVTAYQEGRTLQAEAYLNLASNYWEQCQHLFGAVIKHEETDQVTTEFARLLCYVQGQDTDDFQSNCAALQAMLRHIREMEWPYFRNIL